MADKDFQEGVSFLGRWYWSEVRNLAAEAIGEHPADEVDRQEWIDETCDGHEFVIYTFKAQAVLLVSDNWEAYEDDFGDDEPAAVSVRAYWALRADVSEQVEALLSGAVTS